jgi:hypothetical protein
MTANSLARPRGWLRPSQDTQVGMRRFVAQFGERLAVDHFGICRATIARIAGGLAVQAVTLRAVEDGLSTAPYEDAR